MKKNILLCTLLSSFIYADEEKAAVKVDPECLTLEIVNNNNNNHKIEVRNEQDPYDCSKYVGDELKLRMRYLSKEHFKANLINFSPRTRQAYRDSLTINEAVAVLAELNADDRAELQQALGKEHETFIPVLESKIAAHKKENANNERWTARYFGLAIIGFFLL